MNAKRGFAPLILLAVIAIVAISLIGYYIYTKPKIENTEGNNLPQTNASSTTVRILTDTTVNIGLLKSFNSSPISFTSTKGDVIKFIGAIEKARNPGSNLYINDTKVSTVDGQGVLENSFSPDNKYFSFKTRSICGAGCENTTLYITYLLDKKSTVVLPPRKQKDYLGDTSKYVDKVAKPFIESYSWDKDALKITFYFVGVDKVDGKSYRISEKQIWNYNLQTNQYTLIETIPDS
jgi:hypothetical protein